MKKRLRNLPKIKFKFNQKFRLKRSLVRYLKKLVQLRHNSFLSIKCQSNRFSFHHNTKTLIHGNFKHNRFNPLRCTSHLNLQILTNSFTILSLQTNLVKNPKSPFRNFKSFRRIRRSNLFDTAWIGREKWRIQRKWKFRNSKISNLTHRSRRENEVGRRKWLKGGLRRRLRSRCGKGKRS